MYLSKLKALCTIKAIFTYLCTISHRKELYAFVDNDASTRSATGVLISP